MAADALARAVAAVAVLAVAAPVVSHASSAGDAVREAQAMEAAGSPDDAEAFLRRVLESGVAGRDASLLMAVARLTASPEEAIELCREVIETSRDARLAAAARVLRGDYLYARGSYAEAAVEYEAAATGGPRDARAPAALKRASSLLAAGDAPAAEAAYRAAAASGDTPPDLVPWAAVGAARAVLAQGRAAEAAAEFEAAALASEGHEARLQALSGAAAAHDQAGNTEAAVAALTAVAAEYPGTYDAVLAEERLRAIAAAAEAPAAAGPDSAAVLPVP